MCIPKTRPGWSCWVDWHTPLCLRQTLRIFREISDRPYLSFLWLLWPVPWHFHCPRPDSPRTLTSCPGVVDERYRDTYKLSLIPLWRMRDTPLGSFYRIYEAYCADNDDLVGYETEYFWKRSEPSWAVKLLPDPRDPDPERYAVMATLVEQLTDAFNWRLEIGKRRNGTFVERHDDGTPAPFTPESCPSWLQKVPALENMLVLHEWPEFEEEHAGLHISRYNVKAASGALMTV